jgi:di/tricarboxylate transporter
MFSTISPQQVSFFIILIVSFLLLLTERLRNDIVAVLIIISLYSTGVLSSHEALSGFGSEPAIVLAGIFVLTSALSHTGLSEKIGDLIGRFSGRSYSGSLGVIMPAVGFMSAFTHHVTTTAMMLPVVLNMSRDRGLPASKLLMPLSFAASLGTTITIIGAPAFLIASSTLQQAGRPGLGIFSITPIGVALTIAGTLFTLFIGRFLLPVRQGGADLNERFRLEEYYTEIEILPTSRFLSKTVEEVEADTRYNFRVAGIVRNKRHKKPPLGKHVLEAGDILLVRTSPEEILAIREEAGLELHPIARYGGRDRSFSQWSSGGGGQACSGSYLTWLGSDSQDNW